MKKYLLILTGFICAAYFFGSCKANTLRGEGAKGTANPVVSSFSAIDLDIPITATINVREGGQPGVSLSGYNNVIQHIKARVKNNTLQFYSDLDETWDIDYDDITAEITLPAIVALSLSGAPEANVHGTVTGRDFKLEISGAGKVVIDNLNVDNFSSEVSGAADIQVKGGTVIHSDYEISGAGKILAFPLQTAETTVSISGAGEGEVTAIEKLTANISGAGSIKYKGHPAIKQDVSGAGSVTEAN